MAGWLLITALILFIGFQMSDGREEPADLSYSEFLEQLDDSGVQSATINPDGKVTGELSNGQEYTTQIPVAVVGEELGARLEASGVSVEGEGPSTSWSTWVLALGPIALLVGFFVWMTYRSSRASDGRGFMPKSTARVIDEQRPQVRFSDVAGYDGVKEELDEVIQVLRNPQRFAALGAKGPRGVLMLGPPGTGKTLLARAIAGEADVPFLTITGSGFVELFVGVGAARVRDLFAQARRMAPAIIFIDEIDAVGQRRGASALHGNDEREQTLNQLLAEMDGFDSAEGVIVLAATNRPDVLDPALLRPGRFDRHVYIPLPNRAERQAILDVHCRSKPLTADVDTGELARATPGFSGADLANLANEAAIAAIRHEHERVSRADFDEARDRIVLGRRDRSNILLPSEKCSVAAHEAGHALVAALIPGTDPVSRVTILPSGPTLGATEQLPLDDRHLYLESFLRSTLAVQLGGRAGELVAVGEPSSGASDDLAKATDIATRMVCELGMSATLGPVGYSATRDKLGPTGAALHEYADATQRAIDTEVASIVRQAEKTAIELLEQHQEQLERLIELLIDEETVDGKTVYELAGAPVPAEALDQTPATPNRWVGSHVGPR